MAQRKRTPDILGDLLGDKSLAEIPVNPHNSKTASRQNDLSASQFAGKTANRQNRETAISDETPLKNSEAEQMTKGKVKLTFYLDEASVEQLEDAQLSLRKLARKNGKVSGKAATSKSALLEEALKIACHELESQGEHSQIAQNLLAASPPA